jgi:hypothetical protein
MTYRIAFPIVVLMAATGCGGGGTTGPTANALNYNESVSSSRSVSENDASERSRRGGPLYVTKECSAYEAKPNQLCTITSSNVPEITVGSTVVYKDGAVGALVDTDLVLHAAGPGNNTAFGHVVLDLATGRGVVTFAGGTGKFQRFFARVDVTPLGWPNFAWDGRYVFRGNRAED